MRGSTRYLLRISFRAFDDITQYIPFLVLGHYRVCDNEGMSRSVVGLVLLYEGNHCRR